MSVHQALAAVMGELPAIGKRKSKHGFHGTPLYKAWENMRQRTTNRQTYPTYAGVNCDPRWETFEGFLANQPTTGIPFEPGLCLARACDEGDYAPENTRWLSRSENRREQRPPAPKTHCINGHEYTEKNSAIGSDGKRRCVECRRIRNQEWRRRHV